VVRKGGFEPPRYCYRQPLKLVRLPVPPLPRGWVRHARSDTASVAAGSCEPQYMRPLAPATTTRLASIRTETPPIFDLSKVVTLNVTRRISTRCDVQFQTRTPPTTSTSHTPSSPYYTTLTSSPYYFGALGGVAGAAGAGAGAGAAGVGVEDDAGAGALCCAGAGGGAEPLSTDPGPR
jgi:hypothetical protein